MFSCHVFQGILKAKPTLECIRLVPMKNLRCFTSTQFSLFNRHSILHPEVGIKYHNLPLSLIVIRSNCSPPLLTPSACEDESLTNKFNRRNFPLLYRLSKIRIHFWIIVCFSSKNHALRKWPIFTGIARTGKQWLVVFYILSKFTGKQIDSIVVRIKKEVICFQGSMASYDVSCKDCLRVWHSSKQK